MTVTTGAPLRAGREESALVIAQLDIGDAFDALDFAGDHVWGRAVAHNLVGYVAQAALARAEDAR